MKEYNIPGFEKLIHFYDGNIEHLNEVADFVARIATKGTSFHGIMTSDDSLAIGSIKYAQKKGYVSRKNYRLWDITIPC